MFFFGENLCFFHSLLLATVLRKQPFCNPRCAVCADQLVIKWQSLNTLDRTHLRSITLLTERPSNLDTRKSLTSPLMMESILLLLKTGNTWFLRTPSYSSNVDSLYFASPPLHCDSTNPAIFGHIL